ncbi:MAG: hypothetical protein U1E28_00055 [Beijerinckiaceae bacterium]
MAVLAGTIIALVWLAASAVWGFMVLMGGVMANDSGAVASERHAALLAIMMAGVVAAALAGPAAGCAIFWSDARRPLLWTCGALLAGGLALQIYAWRAFVAAAAMR